MVLKKIVNISIIIYIVITIIIVNVVVLHFNALTIMITTNMIAHSNEHIYEVDNRIEGMQTS